MFCPNCGKEIPDSSKFCPECGGGIAASPEVKNESRPEPAAYTPEPPAAPASAPEQPAYKPEPPVTPSYAAAPAEQYAQPQQNAYARQPAGYAQPVQNPIPAPKQKTKRPIAAMIVTFVCLGLAILIFLLTFVVLYPAQRQGDASLSIYDVEGTWTADINVSGKDDYGDDYSLQMRADMDMVYDYSDYVVITMTPTSYVENGDAASSDEMAENTATFYGYFYNGYLYFNYPAAGGDVTIKVAMYRQGSQLAGEGGAEVSDYGADAQLDCSMSRVSG